MSDVISRLNTALEGRYSVERQVGEGGMATIFLASDHRHHRNVALKVLKPELAAAVGADRFLAEIWMTANLQHPHILPLFDSGEADGLLYYVMPYVQGESLRHRLEAEEQLPIDQAVRIARDVAEALEAAHEQGVIHRDIKPANILLSRGRALVADFGIARAAAASERAGLTRTGSSLGTAGYMSPEQVAGDTELDHRTDIYGLGCMLFEMLTGERPYAGPTLLAVLAKQATEPVPSVRDLRPEATEGLDRAVTVSLAKDPEDRFESAAAFAAALAATPRSVAGAAALEATSPSAVGGSGPGEEGDASTPEDKSKTVVVLPFVNTSGDPENEYFSDGLTEEVISDLSRVAALQVISRNSAMALKGRSSDTRTIAQELGVSHLVTGSVRRFGEALRVTAELVECRTDAPVWSEKYSGTMEDVFGIQEKISRQIVSALQVMLTDTEERHVSERPIEDVLAYDCYLRARQEMYTWTVEAPRRSLRLVDDAIAIAGESPLLLAMKGQIYWSQVNQNLATADEAVPKASRFVERALAMDPDFPLAIYVRGLVAGARGRVEEALPDLYRAHEASPGDSNILAETCRYSNVAGLRRHGRLVDRLAQIDPLTPVTPLVVSTYLCFNGRQAEAAEPARRAMELSPGASMLHMYAAWQLAEAGFAEDAAVVLGETGSALAGTAMGSVMLFLKGALDGNAEEAVRHVTPDMERALHNEFSTRFVADAYALLGYRDEALRWLRTTIGRGFINHPCLAEHDVFLESLRGDQEYQQLMSELKPRWETVVEWERGLG